MALTLHVVAGPDKGKTFELDENADLVLGRSQNSSLRINDPHCSRAHCKIRVESGQVTVNDNGSTGGTFINHGKITALQQLKPGDLLRVGESQLMLKGAQPDPSSATLPPLSSGPSVTSADIPNLVGERLASFELLELLNSGDTGFIFKANDTRDNKTVALKILKPEISGNEEEMQRFVRAMKTMLPLTHPNLVQLYGAGKTGPLCWVSMELIEGESMTKVIERSGVANMLDWQYGLRVSIHIGRALEYAAQNQVVHRNISPANIIMRSNDKMVKLGDMMLAKALEGANVQDITGSGQLVGDLRYMSPERTGGGQIDTRSDIYGLGATVYALLTGRPPFESSSMIDTISKIRNDTPKPPREFQLSIPGQFEGIVLKCLEKRPEDRFQSPAEMVKELEWVAKLNGVTC